MVGETNLGKENGGSSLKKVSDFVYEIEKKGKMKVPVRVYASDSLFEGIKDDKSLEQIQNVAKLPGVIDFVYAMPDAHQGYGFPIGGVAGFDLEEGIVSPGGVGYDINCGVRILSTDISKEDFLKNRKAILDELRRTIPSGVGKGHSHEKKLSDEELKEVLVRGAEWAVENDFGLEEDLERCEEGGKISGANPEDVSERARARGRPQLGTLGAGNHFLDFLEVEEIFDEKTADIFNLRKGKIVVMIHCGSRGLGHQIASDYIKLMEKNFDSNLELPDRELVYAKINSELGKKYLSAMNCAVNFAFCNRQMIMNYVRGVLFGFFPSHENSLVYDVCHNIAKIEEHLVSSGDKKMKKKICVHRKGATRAFGAGRLEVPKVYRKVGQPVIIPGSMGTASYVLVGTKKAEEISFGSTAHGAGRVMSRSKATKKFSAEKVRSSLKEKDIELSSGSDKTVCEESPDVYKNIDEVVEVSDKLGIAKKVVKLKPLAVING